MIMRRGAGHRGSGLSAGRVCVMDRRLPKIDEHQLAVLQAALTGAGAGDCLANDRCAIRAGGLPWCRISVERWPDQVVGYWGKRCA